MSLKGASYEFICISGAEIEAKNVYISSQVATYAPCKTFCMFRHSYYETLSQLFAFSSYPL